MFRTAPLLLLLACGGTSSPQPATAPAHHADPAPPADDPHAGHAAHSGHMAEMAKTRDALRATLGAAYDAPVPGLDTADAAAGATLYATHCASCHGATGKGDGDAGRALSPPPSDLTDVFHARFYSDAGRVEIVRRGAAGTAMPGFADTLDDAAILAVYAHVRSLRPTLGAP